MFNFIGSVHPNIEKPALLAGLSMFGIFKLAPGLFRSFGHMPDGPYLTGVFPIAAAPLITEQTIKQKKIESKSNDKNEVYR